MNRKTESFADIDIPEASYAEELTPEVLVEILQLLHISEEDINSDEEFQRIMALKQEQAGLLALTRIREVALAKIAPTVRDIGNIFQELKKNPQIERQLIQQQKLSYFSLALATGKPEHQWNRVKGGDFLERTGEEKERLLGQLMKENKLQAVTLFERSTGLHTFETYRKNCGSLTKEQYELASRHEATRYEIVRAAEDALNATAILPSELQGVERDVVEAMAKIKFGSGHPNTDNASWLLSEGTWFSCNEFHNGEPLW